MRFLIPLLFLLSIPVHAFEDVRLITKQTYTANSAAFSPPATPTDLCYITGSATKLVKLRRVEMSSTQTTAGLNSIFLIKRSTANSSGTAVAMTAVPHDSGLPASTVNAVQTYTANPTTGTAVGNIRVAKLLSPAPASTVNAPWVWDFDVFNESAPIVLRGIAEGVAVNFGGATLPSGLSVHCSFTWTEE